MPHPLPEVTPSLGKRHAHGELENHLKDLQNCRKKQLLSEGEYCATKQQLLQSFSTFSPPITNVRQNDGVAQANFQEDPANPVSWMRFGFGRLVSPQACQKRGTQFFEIGVPVFQEARNSLRDRSIVDDAEQRYRFWCGLIIKNQKPAPVPYDNRLKLKKSRTFGEGAKRKLRASTSMADLQVYDITASRVQELFYGAGDDLVNGDRMDAEGLVRRLGELDLSVSPESAESLIKKVQWAGGSDEKSNHIDVGEFDLVLTTLRLAELFTPHAGVFRFQEDGQDRCTNQIYICDYCAVACCLEDFTNVEEFRSLDLEPNSAQIDVRRFFFDVHREKELLSRRVQARDQVRWVHIDASEKGLDRLTVLRLATKYHLHPLAVEDVIENRTPPKVDDFEDHYFVSMDVISLVQTDDEYDDDGDEQVQLGEHRVQTQRSNASIFLSKAPVCDTLLSIFQDRPDETSWLAMWRGKGKAAEKEQPVPDGTLWERVQKNIEKVPPTRVRDQKADFLLYEILDQIVNELQPITEAYSQRLGYMHQRDPWNWSAHWLEELSEVHLELTDLARSIRPMRQVVHYFIHNGRIGRAAQIYLEDTEDQIDRTLDDFSQLQEMIGTLTRAYEGSQDKTMNLMLFVLSIVSAIFLPAQFVTGLYGMNFEGLMPELEWTEPISGYVYFWLLQLALLLFSVCMLFFIHSCSRKAARIEDCCRRIRKTFYTPCCRRRDQPFPEAETELF